MAIIVLVVGFSFGFMDWGLSDAHIGLGFRVQGFVRDIFFVLWRFMTHECVCVLVLGFGFSLGIMHWGWSNAHFGF